MSNGAAPAIELIGIDQLEDRFEKVQTVPFGVALDPPLDFDQIVGQRMQRCGYHDLFPANLLF